MRPSFILLEKRDNKRFIFDAVNDLIISVFNYKVEILLLKGEKNSFFFMSIFYFVKNTRKLNFLVFFNVIPFQAPISREYPRIR